ncbi:DUF7669 domain-containing protein [Neobacillus sp. LXY-4]|uniref:DUF7669 domain-containing protein n=1 Tax=Neobacillus sp. LXY-4 TaxID=3379826 RepID=UPI003EE1ED43
MRFKTCREEILYTVKLIISAKNKNEFTIKEVTEQMNKNKTIYKENTISTHISSKCCINSPSHHATVYNDFQRIKPGIYQLCYETVT